MDDKSKAMKPEANMSRNPPGAKNNVKQREPGVSDETRVIYAEEPNLKDGGGQG